MKHEGQKFFWRPFYDKGDVFVLTGGRVVRAHTTFENPRKGKKENQGQTQQMRLALRFNVSQTITVAKAVGHTSAERNQGRTQKDASGVTF